jgi:hypothetical protein
MQPISRMATTDTAVAHARTGARCDALGNLWLLRPVDELTVFDGVARIKDRASTAVGRRAGRRLGAASTMLCLLWSGPSRLPVKEFATASAEPRLTASRMHAAERRK